jgi:hypothetical protein
VTLAVDPLAAPTAGRRKRRAKPDTGRREVTYRHTRVTRLTHWINVVAFVVLLMTGLQIFNGHPALYWGSPGSEYEPTNTFLSIQSETRGGEPVGVTRLGPARVRDHGRAGRLAARRPDRDAGLSLLGHHPEPPGPVLRRLWHFFFAWLLVLNGCSTSVVGC